MRWISFFIHGNKKTNVPECHLTTSKYSLLELEQMSPVLSGTGRMLNCYMGNVFLPSLIAENVEQLCLEPCSLFFRLKFGSSLQ